jgi:hypothetical protein
MNKHKLIPVLGAVLVLQVLLAVVLNWGGLAGQSENGNTQLLSFTADQIDEIRIEDGESSVELKKADQAWRLPEIDFPAGAEQLNSLFEKLTDPRVDWPIATTGVAAKRFKVADDDYERKITFSKGGETVAVLYLGTSPGYRQLHARLNGSDDVYLIEFSMYDAQVDTDDWIDKGILHRNVEEITAVNLPDLVLKKQSDSWTIEGLKEDEQPNVTEIESLVKKAAGLSIDGVRGKEPKKEYGFDDRPKTVVLTLSNGDSLTYQLAKPENDAHYVVKSSALEHYLSVPQYVVKPLVEPDRQKLVQPKGAEPEGEAEENTDGK